MLRRVHLAALNFSLSLTACMFSMPSDASTQYCATQGDVVLQVLGSGGPIADDARASSGYVIYVDGHARLLIDAGGGSALRFGEAGARVADLRFIGLSHTHTDHSSDIVGFLKSGQFVDGPDVLVFAGPSGRGLFPGIEDFMERLIGPQGAYAYLSSYLTTGSTRLSILEVETGPAQTVFDDGSVSVQAMHVPHGIVPAVGFRISASNRVIVFGSDQNGSDERFASFARDADVLVMHLPIPEAATGVAVRLHARPSTVGTVARRAGARRLLLSHFMARALNDARSVPLVEEAFGSKVDIASDLLCLPIAEASDDSS